MSSKEGVPLSGEIRPSSALGRTGPDNDSVLAKQNDPSEFSGQINRFELSDVDTLPQCCRLGPVGTFLQPRNSKSASPLGRPEAIALFAAVGSGPQLSGCSEGALLKSSSQLVFGSGDCAGTAIANTPRVVNFAWCTESEVKRIVPPKVLRGLRALDS